MRDQCYGIDPPDVYSQDHFPALQCWAGCLRRASRPLMLKWKRLPCLDPILPFDKPWVRTVFVYFTCFQQTMMKFWQSMYAWSFMCGEWNIWISHPAKSKFPQCCETIGHTEPRSIPTNTFKAIISTSVSVVRMLSHLLNNNLQRLVSTQTLGTKTSQCSFATYSVTTQSHKNTVFLTFVLLGMLGVSLTYPSTCSQHNAAD